MKNLTPGERIKEYKSLCSSLANTLLFAIIITGAGVIGLVYQVVSSIE
jgi:hypothetical protein